MVTNFITDDKMYTSYRLQTSSHHEIESEILLVHFSLARNLHRRLYVAEVITNNNYGW